MRLMEDKDLREDIAEETEAENPDGDTVKEEASAEETEEKNPDTAGEDSKEETPEDEEKNDKHDKSDKKKKKPDKKTEALQNRVDELEDRVKRQMAEFDNFRKRTEKEKSQMFETGARTVIEKILPVVDNFERGLATVPEDEAGSPFAEGMNMIYKQLMDELDKMEVKPIEALGCEFDPDLHNAVMQVESDEFESGIIAQELQKGYTYRGTVVRHSMVAVVT